MRKLNEFTARDNWERAHSMNLGKCNGNCPVHIVLMDERGHVFADAPMSIELIKKYYVRFGEIIKQYEQVERTH